MKADLGKVRVCATLDKILDAAFDDAADLRQRRSPTHKPDFETDTTRVCVTLDKALKAAINDVADLRQQQSPTHKRPDYPELFTDALLLLLKQKGVEPNGEGRNLSTECLHHHVARDLTRRYAGLHKTRVCVTLDKSLKAAVEGLADRRWQQNPHRKRPTMPQLFAEALLLLLEQEGVSPDFDLLGLPRKPGRKPAKSVAGRRQKNEVPA